MRIRKGILALAGAAIVMGGVLSGCNQSSEPVAPVADKRPTRNDMPPEARARMEAAQRAAQQAAPK